MSRLFGTDGVRGVANRDLTAQLALDLSVAAAHILGSAGVAPSPADGSPGASRRRPVAVVGRDPRASGEFLEAVVVGALASAGVDVRRVGVLPTPGVAYLLAATDADFGVVISASHNPMPDNGIKFFARGGLKLDDVVEDAIEAAIAQPTQRPVGADVGRIVDVADSVTRYVEHVTSTVSTSLAGLTIAVDCAEGAASLTAPAAFSAAGADVGRIVDVADSVTRYVEHVTSTVSTSLAGLKIVVDCAEGAASLTAPAAFSAAGADVVAIHNEPDGLNINEGCGSTHLGSLQRAVVEHEADVGFALDGDADRCLAVDASGQVVDGDQLLAILALAQRDAGALPHDTVVATVMSNLGFMVALRDAGVTVVQAKVGDRYVLEEMRAGGFALGGEQSGHLIMSDYATTGDGLLAALHVAARMASTGHTLAALAAVMAKYPQTLINVPDVDKARANSDVAVAAAVRDAEEELGLSGRVLLRPSGTEALVRVMVEAESSHQADSVARRLADVVKASLAL